MRTSGAPLLSSTRATANTAVVSLLGRAKDSAFQAIGSLPGTATSLSSIQLPHKTDGSNLEFNEPVPINNKL